MSLIIVNFDCTVKSYFYKINNGVEIRETCQRKSQQSWTDAQRQWGSLKHSYFAIQNLKVRVINYYF